MPSWPGEPRSWYKPSNGTSTFKRANVQQQTYVQYWTLTPNSSTLTLNSWRLLLSRPRPRRHPRLPPTAATSIAPDDIPAADMAYVDTTAPNSASTLDGSPTSNTAAPSPVTGPAPAPRVNPAKERGPLVRVPLVGGGPMHSTSAHRRWRLRSAKKQGPLVGGSSGGGRGGSSGGGRANAIPLQHTCGGACSQQRWGPGSPGPWWEVFWWGGGAAGR